MVRFAAILASPKKGIFRERITLLNSSFRGEKHYLYLGLSFFYPYISNLTDPVHLFSACTLVKRCETHIIITTTMDKKDLFVAEDEDISESPALEEYQDTNEEVMEEEDDDPVILTLPIFHGSLPHRSSQSLHVLQYTNRPKNRPFTDERLKTSIKVDSKVVEVKVPMDTSKFYDESRCDELGGQVVTSNLQGVLTSTDGGLYVGQLVEKDEALGMVLIPVDSTAQLKPLFKYIDDLDLARSAHARQEAATLDQTKPAAVQVLQTAAKASNQLLSEGTYGGLGSCLRHIKRFDEEQWASLNWRSANDPPTREILNSLQAPSQEVTETVTAFEEFL